MYLYKKIVVCLDLSDMDETLIRFADSFSKIYDSTDVYFINVIRNFQVPDDLLKEVPDIYEKVKAEREDNLKSKVCDILQLSEGCRYFFEVLQGNTSKQILKYGLEKEADLIIVGNKADGKSSGVAVQRIARRASCSLLILPRDSKADLHKILVPSDFSDYSTIALQEAVHIASHIRHGVHITVQNVFYVPVGYHFTGKTYEEFTEVMRSRAVESYEKFVAQIDLMGHELEQVYSLDEDEDPVEDIYLKAKEIGADIIVIGAKGRTSTAAIFLGSMAERLIRVDTEIPILVVRPKGKTEGLLDYLKEL
jgi:nucleotide-binding universal stress UspA family protein